MDIEPLIRMADVIVNCMWREAQLLCYFINRTPFEPKAQYGDFGRGELMVELRAADYPLMPALAPERTRYELKRTMAIIGKVRHIIKGGKITAYEACCDTEAII